MTDRELTEFFDSFVARADQHDRCAMIAIEASVVAFHRRLGDHYRNLARETEDMRQAALSVRNGFLEEGM